MGVLVVISDRFDFTSRAGARATRQSFIVSSYFATSKVVASCREPSKLIKEYLTISVL